MRTRFIHLASLVAALAATAIASSLALAQTSSPTKFTGKATGAGTSTRTITDITEPNGPVTSPFGIVQVQSTMVTVPVSMGDSAITIGTAFRDAINGNATLTAAGYSSVFTTPNGSPMPSRPKMVRQVGTYSVIDAEDVPGITMSGAGIPADQFTVEDAPAFSPVGLGFLFGALPALAFWKRRRRKTA
jgi:hypothetical protein